MEIKKIHWIGIIAGLVVSGLSFLFQGSRFFFFILWFGIIIGVAPFVLTTIQQTRVTTEKEEMFLEFTRNLVESVRTGTPISKSIVNMKKKPFGVLSKHVEKLANQISLGIPLGTALQTFAHDINNNTVSRTITLIGQAEKGGGNIGEILESVAKAVAMTDKLKKERKAAISTLTVQGYIIFIVFIVIVLVMQFYIIPMISGIATTETLGVGGIPGGGGTPFEAGEVSQAFLYLLLIQGLFSGLTIGKLSEGDIKAGLKHSFALVVLSFMIAAAANIFFGG
ncbi:MAG: type II secretion system F family protein [Candidatus Nanoarchaeia archaeon]|nr:type II secretion system F family protein [Candidatus Nanoarchaeia archaeon]MDD5357689.1 type II secretion system F family protein [Candidatus Nanoarchaeia archaeon]MDD5588608.1 type II secretion system F family protein [Candidatus Nanoarchaeia archaeon]